MAGKHLSHLALSDDGFLFDSSSGNTYTLNATGALVLKKLIAGDDCDQIAAAVMAFYETSEEIVFRDIDQFFQYLLELDITSNLP